MSDKEVSVKLTARDETAQAYDSAIKRHKQYTDLRVQTLQNAARLGDEGAGIKAEEVEIGERYAAQRRAILRMLQEDVTISKEQRSTLEGELATLMQQEGIERVRLQLNREITGEKKKQNAPEKGKPAGGGQLEKAAEMGAATIMADQVGEAFDKAGESAKAFGEQLEKASGGNERAQAFHDLARSWAEAIPAVGPLVHGIKSLEDGLGDAAAAWAKTNGASEETIDGWRSDAGMIKHYNEIIAEQTAAIEKVTQARRALITETLKGIRGGVAGNEQRAAAQAADEAENRHNENVKKNREESYKLQQEAGDNPNSQQKQLIASYRQRDLLELKRYGDEKGRLANDATQAIAEAAEREGAVINEARLRRRESENLAGDILREHNRMQQESEFDSQQKIGDLKAEAEATRARNEHRDADGAMIELKRRHDREIAASVESEKREIEAIEEVKTRKENSGAIVDQAQVDSDKRGVSGRAAIERMAGNERFLADQAAAKKAAENSAIDEADQRHHTVQSMRLELLKEEAAMGNQAAKTAAKALGIQEKFTEKKAEANRLLREAKDLTAAEKKELEDSIKKYDTLQQAEIAKMKMGQIGAPTSPFSQQSEMGEGNTGMREAFGAGVQSMEDRKIDLMQKNLDAILAGNTIAANARDAAVALNNKVTVGGLT